MAKTLNISEYTKHNYENIKDLLNILKEPKNVTRELLNDLFSAIPDGDTFPIKILPPKYRATDYFDLPKSFDPEFITEDIKDTTLGLFIFNYFVIKQSFGINSSFKYSNETIGTDQLDNVMDMISSDLLENKITVENFATFTNSVVWLGYMNELFTPGINTDIIIPNKKVMKEKERLLKENPELLQKDRLSSKDLAVYLEKIEKPLMKLAKEELKNSSAMRLYELKKPSFGNNYKNSCVINGPLKDPVTDKYILNPNCYVEGSNPEVYDVLANKAMLASYGRAVNTQVGGSYSKYLSAASLVIVLGPKGSDCKTNNFLIFPVNKMNYKTIRYCYMRVGDKDVLIDAEMSKNLIGKTIKLRNPLFCKSKEICNKCAGEMYYKLNIKNIGLTASIATNTCTNASMKAMHDITIKSLEVNNIEDFFDFVPVK